MSHFIPDLQLVGDSIRGRLYRLPGGTLASIGTVPESLSAIHPLAHYVSVAYGLSVRSSNEVIMPGLFAPEPNRFVAWWEAWHYIHAPFFKHPQASVVGLNLKGKRTLVLWRNLDFSVPVHVVAFVGGNPVGEVNGLWIGEDADRIPHLMAQLLPVVDDLSQFVTDTTSP